MTNRKTTRKALVLSLLSLLLCCSMLVGTTFAWFTDSVTSGNNKIVAGNLDVELEYLVDGKWEKVTETTNVFEEDTLWEPGHTEVVYLKISNLGTLALDYRLGVNIASETGSINVEGVSFKLSDYIMVGVVKGLDETKTFADRDAARAADFSYSTEIKEGYAQFGTLYAKTNMPTDTQNAVSEEYVCMVVYMPEETGNEANYRTGEAAPQIVLGIDLFATQQTYEKDSFNDQYDLNAAAGTSEVVTNGYTSVEAWNLDKTQKAATIEVPAAAVAAEADEITLNVVETEDDESISITADQSIQSYDISVSGIKEGNTEGIKVQLQIGTGLTGVKLYHKGVEIAYDYYNAETGYLIFHTTSFSPFSVVFDTEAKPVEPTDPELPDAALTAMPEHANVSLDWKGYNGLKPSNDAQQLEVVYNFSTTQTTEQMQASKYRTWYCDFYVSCDRDVAAGAICLGGNYGGYGWVGFENIDTPVAANTKVPLLGSVGNPWTYEAIYSMVGNFMCGVARTYGTDLSELAGATFTVELRLTNPDNADEYKIVETVNYTFPAVESGN